MRYIKSCGAVVFTRLNNEIHYVIIRQTNGDWGFPKGHMELNETEYETAIRELKEETNVEVQVIDGFRRQIEYKFPNKANVMKQSVYFLGKCTAVDVVCQETEVSEALFVPIEVALELLSFEDTKNILKEVDIYLDTLSLV